MRPAFARSSRCTPVVGRGCVGFPCTCSDNSRVTKALRRLSIGHDAQYRGGNLQKQHCPHTDATRLTRSGHSHRSWQRAVAWHARQLPRNGATCEHHCAAILSRLDCYEYASSVLAAEHARNLRSSGPRRFFHRTRFRWPTCLPCMLILRLHVHGAYHREMGHCTATPLPSGDKSDAHCAVTRCGSDKAICNSMYAPRQTAAPIKSRTARTNHQTPECHHWHKLPLHTANVKVISRSDKMPPSRTMTRQSP
jgi:hypothetical protein